MRPEFGARPDGPDNTLSLHQYLIGLRRRNAWLHTATTQPLQLSNTGYVYRTGTGADSLVVALNIGDAPLSADLPEPGRVVAGSGAPPADRVEHIVVPPHGWVIVD